MPAAAPAVQPQPYPQPTTVQPPPQVYQQPPPVYQQPPPYQQQATTTPYVPQSQQPQKVNPGWWAVAFFFSIIGGIVAYVVVKKKNPSTAMKLLIFGIVWFLIEMLISFGGWTGSGGAGG